MLLPHHQLKLVANNRPIFLDRRVNGITTTAAKAVAASLGVVILDGNSPPQLSPEINDAPS
jgi:hypothetical protein